LIPAGTGFNCFENLKKAGKVPSPNLLVRSNKNENVKSYVLKSRLD